MRWIPQAAPKPRPKEKQAKVGKPRSRLRTRTRMKSRNAKRGGSAFPKVRDKAYCTWLVTANPCHIAGRGIWGRICGNDEIAFPITKAFIHRCWYGDRGLDPAHVGKHRAKGAPDFGHVVPLCPAAHQFYDEHRSQWGKVTQLSEKEMASAASGYALRYVERGGRVEP